MGYLLLEGGSEFGGRMSEPDRRAIALAGGLEVRIAILPTAAAPDHNHDRAGRNGLRWFQSLGASQLDLLPVTDKAAADDPDLAARVRSAQLIYLLGGFPAYLEETLRGSRVWQAAVQAYEQGAVIAGSSAGAMVLCEHYYDPDRRKLLPGLDLLPDACVLPHHNTFGRGWAVQLARQLPRSTLIGIDEQTGVIHNDPPGAWTVYGAGEVKLYREGRARVYVRGETFSVAGGAG